MFQLISLFILLSTIMSANKQIILFVSEKFDASEKEKGHYVKKTFPYTALASFYM